MDADADRYEAWYTRKLWSLLPAIYRAEDSKDVDRVGPLQELVGRIGVEAAIVRRSIDRLWEDQMIETCDDWVVDYIGDLLGTNMVPSLDGRERRADVGKTIYYRRRKGTVALLEELASDVTGWTVRVVEFFRRLARARYGLDVPLGLPVPLPDPRAELQRAQGLFGVRTRTGVGGLADLRDAHGANLTNTAFDEYFHTADVRRGRGATGWYDIPRLGVFAWRLHSLGVSGVTAVQSAACANQHTFDPTGRDIQLFARQQPASFDDWLSPEEHEVPGPISADLLSAHFGDLYGFNSLFVRRKVGPLPDDYADVPANEVKPDPRVPVGRFFIDPVRGRTVAPAGVDDGPFLVDYHYGFTSEIGAGPYDRRALGSAADGQPAPVADIQGGGDRLQTALTGLGPTATVTIDDSRTYDRVADVAGITAVTLRSENFERPLIRPDVSAWVLTGDPGAVLTLDGVFLSGCDLVVRGEFDRVFLRCCTLDPGRWDTAHNQPATAVDGAPLTPAKLRIEGVVRELIVDRSILGPIGLDVGALVESLTAHDTVIQAVEPGVGAIALATGETRLVRCSVLGSARLHRVDASECILSGDVQVDDRQHGCLRFSAWIAGSRVPRQYECAKLASGTALFASREFGVAVYAQVLDTAGAQVLEGAEDGSELGAFARERRAPKERSLLIEYREYLPLGLEPVLVHVT